METLQILSIRKTRPVTSTIFSSPIQHNRIITENKISSTSNERHNAAGFRNIPGTDRNNIIAPDIAQNTQKHKLAFAIKTTGINKSQR